MTTRCKPVLFAALCVPCLVLNIGAQSSPARPESGKTNWATVQALPAGTEVLVALNGPKDVKGKVETVTEDSILVKSGKRQETVTRGNISWLSVRVSRRKSHVASSTKMGAVIGAGVGVVFGIICSAAVGSDGAVCYLAVPVGAGLYAGLGAALGAVSPGGGWREIYRAAM